VSVSFVIVGRPNVGKSTLFNRLLGRSRAIVHDEPGVTRDCLSGPIELGAGVARLTDTGGYVPGHEAQELERLVREQVDRAVSGASALLVVFDGREGVTPADEEVVAQLRPLGKPLLGVVNKIDPGSNRTVEGEFYRLGLAKLVEVSAEHGLGIGGLLEAMAEVAPPEAAPETAPAPEPRTAVAFLGRPNVGKSSLINRILNEPRLLVSEIPGTTRDVVDLSVERGGERFLLLDTAGIRKRPKVTASVEQFSVSRSLKAAARAEAVVLVLDARDKLTTQDAKIAASVMQRGSGLLLAANKWDLVKDSERARHEFREDVYAEALFLRFAALRFVSAKTGRGVESLLTDAARIARRRQRVFPKEDLDAAFDAVSAAYPGSGRATSRLRLQRLTQAEGEKVMTFFLWCADPRGVQPDYERYWTNALGETLKLEGVPIRVVFRRRASRKRRTRTAARSSSR
jgi:GTP-binding protein